MPFRINMLATAALLAGWVLVPAGLGQQRRNPPGARAGRPIGPPPRPGPSGRLGPGAAVFDRLERMTPEQRSRMLDRLPPERRKQLEERLRQYDQLPPEEREELRHRLELFRELPPERQEAARRLFARFNKLPEPRRALVRGEFLELRKLEEQERRARINSDEFRSKYTLAEQQLLQDFSNLLAPPGP